MLPERCALKQPRSRAQLTWTRWDGTGRSSAGKGTCRERLVLNPSVALRRAHAGVGIGSDPAAPLSSPERERLRTGPLPPLVRTILKLPESPR